MAIIGIVHPAELLPNAGGKPGDALMLTKPVGTRAVATAPKKGFADEGTVEVAIDVMTQVNLAAADAAREAGEHAMADVTGFGLVGHLHGARAAERIDRHLIEGDPGKVAIS